MGSWVVNSTMSNYAGSGQESKGREHKGRAKGVEKQGRRTSRDHGRRSAQRDHGGRVKRTLRDRRERGRRTPKSAGEERRETSGS
jgi:hypothetical protein